MVQLGQKCKCKITGFVGIATARAEYLYGCVRVELTSNKIDKDGKPITLFIDEGSVEVIDDGLNKKKKIRKATGGPRPAFQQRKDFTR